MTTCRFAMKKAVRSLTASGTRSVVPSQITDKSENERLNGRPGDVLEKLMSKKMHPISTHFSLRGKQIDSMKINCTAIGMKWMAVMNIVETTLNFC